MSCWRNLLKTTRRFDLATVTPFFFDLSSLFAPVQQVIEVDGAKVEFLEGGAAYCIEARVTYPNGSVEVKKDASTRELFLDEYRGAKVEVLTGHSQLMHEFSALKEKREGSA